MATAKNRSVGTVGKVPDLMMAQGLATGPDHASCRVWNRSLRTASREGKEGVVEEELLPPTPKSWLQLAASSWLCIPPSQKEVTHFFFSCPMAELPEVRVPKAV